MDESMRNRLEVACKRLVDIDKELVSEDIMKDISHFREISKERSILEPQVEAYQKYIKNEEDIIGAKEMAQDSDPEIAEMGKEEVKRLEAEQESLEAELTELLLPKDPNDEKNIIVEIRGAVGGDEANIFAGDLFRMYTRYAEAQGWKIQLMDENPSEAGVDKNVALNGFEASRHTSYCADAIAFLRDVPEGKYDLMIVDPPAFAKHRGALSNALRAYQRLNAAAISKVAPGGFVFTFSCSQVVDREAFALAVFSAAAQTGRSVRILDRLLQPADHPVNIYHPEGEYLKGLLLYVE